MRSLSLQARVQRVEECGAFGQAAAVVGMASGDALNHRGDAGRFRPLVAIVLEIEVVDDLRDRLERGVARVRRRAQQHLEGAELTLVRELALEHVEANDGGGWDGAVGRGKDERGGWIDEAA